MPSKKTSMVRYYYFLIIGYINLWPRYAIFSDFFNGFSLAWHSTLSYYIAEDMESCSSLRSNESITLEVAETNSKGCGDRAAPVPGIQYSGRICQKHKQAQHILIKFENTFIKQILCIICYLFCNFYCRRRVPLSRTCYSTQLGVKETLYQCLFIIFIILKLTQWSVSIGKLVMQM